MTSNSDYRFYIVGTGNDYIKFMWKDAIENDNVFYLENPMSAKFPLRDLYNSIEQKLYSYKLNLYLNIPGKNYWRKLVPTLPDCHLTPSSLSYWKTTILLPHW